jgi:hypothetical protein
VTPVLANYTFSPTSTSVVINGANGTAGSFSATAIPPTTYTDTLAAGTGITSITPASLSGATNTTATSTLVLANGYQNPTATGTCAVAISGTTITVTFGTSNCSSTISATAITYTVTLGSDDHLSVLPTTLTVAYGQTFGLTVASDNSSFVVGTPVLSGGVSGGSFSGTTYTSGPVTGTALVYFPAATVGNAYVIGHTTISPIACLSTTIATCPVQVDTYIFGGNTAGSVYVGLSWKFDKNSPFSGSGQYKMTEVTNTPSGERHFTYSFPSGIGLPDTYPRFNNGTMDYQLLEIEAYNGSDNTSTELSSGVTFETLGGLGFNPDVGLGVVIPSLANATSTKVANGVYLSSTQDVVNVILPCSDTNYWNDATALLSQYFKGPFDAEIVQSVGCTRGESNTPLGGPINNTVPGLGLSVSTSGTTIRAIHIPPSDPLAQYVIHEWRHGRGDYWTASGLPLSNSAGHTSPSTELPGQLTVQNGILTPVAGGYTLLAPSDQKTSNCRHFSTEDNLQEGLVNSTGNVGYLNPSYTFTEGVTIPSNQVEFPTLSGLQATYGVVPYIPHQNLQAAWVVVSDHQLVGAELGLAIGNSEHFESNVSDELLNTQGSIPVCSTPPLQVASGGLILVTTVVTPK